MVTPNRQCVIELHHHILSEENPYAIDMDGMWRRAQYHDVAGAQVRVLAPADMLIHVCIHAAFGHRYEFFPLRTLVDVLGLTSSSRLSLDWDVVLDSVRATRSAGGVYWPLRLSRHWLGAPVPDRVLAALAPPAPMRRLMEPVLESSYVLDGQAPPEWGAKVLYRLLREISLYGGCSAPQQMGAAVRGLFPATDDITHLAPDVTQSRLRYAAALWNPPRLARGAMALGRHLARLPSHLR